MSNKKLLLVLFLIVSGLQLFVPASMIFNYEDILHTGKDYKFKLEPIDPTDPFRGKYITLEFKENEFKITDQEKWVEKGVVYVQLTQDSAGYAHITNVFKEQPESNIEYVKATLNYIMEDDTLKTMRIGYPFNTYYLEESKADKVEHEYRNALKDTNQVTYALVSLKKGEAVIKDVFINNTPIIAIVKAHNNGK